MNEILINLQEPAWWFTGVFFVLIGLLISKLTTSWLPKMFKYLSIIVPNLIGGYFDKRHMKVLYKIKSIRFDDVLVLRELLKKYTYLILLLLSGVIVTSSLMSISIDLELNQSLLIGEKGRQFWSLVTFSSLPIYIFEVFYLKQSEFVNELLRSRAKIRIITHPKVNRASSTLTDIS